MRSPLHARIAALRGRVRRLLALHGLSLVLAGLALFVLAVGLADYSVHLVRPVRVALLIGLAGMVGYLTLRHVVAPLVVRFRDLDIALKIEKRWPGLNDRLASTVQFLEVGEAEAKADQSDTFGSRALRDATIQQTLAETQTIDFRQVVDPRPARRAMLVASGAVAAGLMAFWTHPDLGSLALKRLFLPFASNPWPQATHLEILQAARKVAKGEPFVLEVGVAKGEWAPGSAKITYFYEGGEKSTEFLRPDDRNKFHGRKEIVDRSFEFQVDAGDDSIGRFAVVAVDPPVVTESSVRMTLPAYTGQPPQRLSPNKTQIRAVRGTVVEVEAFANKPIQTAKLVRGEGLPPLNVLTDAKGTKLTAKFELKDSGSLVFDLVDTEGFHSQEKDAIRFELRAVKDESPRVVVEEPSNDRDVTAIADVPIRIVSDDDYGLDRVRMVYNSASGGSEPSPEVIVPLWSNDAAKLPAGEKHKEVPHVWNLAPLKLTPGALLTFHADARDLDNLSGPNLGKSRELRLRIVSPEEKNRQTQAQRQAIREELERALAMQQQAQTPVKDAIRILDQTNTLDPKARDEVRNAETIQNQVNNRITGKADGIERKMKDVLEDMDQNKLDAPDARKQMEEMLQGIEKLRDTNLGPAEQNLNRATKAMDGGENSAKPDEKANADPEKTNAERTPAGDPSKAASKSAESAKDQAGKSAESKKGQGSDPAKGEMAKAGESKAGQEKAQSGESKSGESKSGESKSGESKSGESKSGESKSGESKSGESKSGESKSGESKSGESKSGESSKSQENGKKSSEQPSPSKAAPRAALAEAAKNQQEVADELKRMLEKFSDFEDGQAMIQDGKKLLKKQEDAMRAAADEGAKPEVNGKKADDLTKAEKAALENAADRQTQVSKELAELQNKMDQVANRVEKKDQRTADTLREAADESRKRGTTNTMEDAAQGIEKNQMGQAQTAQKKAQQDLKKLVESLQNRRETELARLLKDLKDVNKDIKDLKKREQQNRDETAKANEMQDPKERAEQLQKLSKEQKQIAQALKKDLLKLQKLNAEQAAQAGAKAAQKMAQAGEEQDQDDADDAQKAQEEALAGLEDVQDEIEQKIQEAEEQLAMEQLSKIKDNLLGLSERQEKVIEETGAYEKKRTEKALTLPQKASVRTLGRTQDALKDEAAELVEKLEFAPAYVLSLKRAVTAMDVASKRLQTLKTDDETQKVETTASKKLKQLLDALKPDQAQGPAGQQQEPPPGRGGQPGQPKPRGNGDGISLAAQLKVLKLMQQEINDRTEEIDEIRLRKKDLSPEQQAELERLTDDQRSIADIARDLTKPKKSDLED